MERQQTITRAHVKDRALNVLQDQLQKNTFSGSDTLRPQNSAEQIENIELEALKEQLVEHRLGRLPRGWHVSRINAAAIVYEKTSLTTTTDLCLVASAACTINLLVW